MKKIFLLLIWAPLALSGQVVTQTFMDATAPGWNFAGVNYTPNLTSGTVDPTGQGWLRLTGTGNNQATSAYYDTAFTAANATVYASFEYQSWGGTGADGIVFFLYDGSQTFGVGANGGSLGYAQKTGVSGLNGGYLGVAIDEYGNFSNGTEGRVGGIGFRPDSFSVRGPGSGTTGYEYLGGTNSLATSIDTPGVSTRPTTQNLVQILISPTNQLTVSLQQGGSSVQSVLSLDLSGYARPDTLKYGFSSGTGGSTNNHEVRNLNVTTLVANLWDAGSGDGLWGSANNWDPNILPAGGADILFNNTHVSTAQTINTGTNRTVRSLSMDAPFAYTLNNNTITFDAGSVPGFTGIAVTQTRGVADHTINSNLALANNITVRNNSTGTLNLNGATNLGNKVITFDGSGPTRSTGVISGTGSVVKNEGGELTLSGNSTFSGGTTLNNGTLQANHNNALGTGGVTLAGGTLASTTAATVANTLTLTGNAGLSGLTTSGILTQSGGNQTLTMNGATQNGAVRLSEGATTRTLTVQVDSGTSTINGLISNGGTATSGNLTKTGTGNLVLGGANTYTGTTTITDGSVSLGASNRLADTSSVAIGSTGTLNLNGFSERIGNLTALGGGATLDFGSSVGANTFVFSTYTAPASGVMVVNNFQAGSDTFGTTSAGQNVGTIYLSGLGVAQVDTFTSTSLYGNIYNIAAAAVAYKEWNGSGSSTWSTNNNWTAANEPTSTQVALFGGLGLGRLTATLNASYTIAGIKFDAAATSSYTLNQSGTPTLTLAGLVPYIQQQSAYQQNITQFILRLGANTVADITGAGNLNISSVISETGGARSLIRDGTGAGKLLLSGNNSYSGGLYINRGVVQASHNNAMGTGAAIISDGGTLELAGGITATNNLSLVGPGAGATGAVRAVSGANTLSGTITQTGAARFAADTGTTLNLTGNLTGTNTNTTFAAAGTGVINVNRITTGTGAVTIESGTVNYNGTTNANTNTGLTTVSSGATLNLNKTSGTDAIGTGGLEINSGTVTLAANHQIADTATVTLKGTGTLNLNNRTETIGTLNSASATSTVALGTGSLTFGGTNESAFAGSFTGAAGSSLNKTGTGKVSVSGSSAGFAGTVNLSAGIINVSGGGASVLGTGNAVVTGTGNLELQGGTTLANNFTLNSYGTGSMDGAIQSITGNNTVTGTVTLAGNSRVQTDAGTLTLTGTTALGANSLNVGGNGNTTLTNIISGTGGLSKDGSGTLTLSGANTYTGTTAINAGTLLLGASNVIANSGTVSLAAAGTLSLNNLTETIGAISGSGTVHLGSAGTGALTLASGVSNFSGFMVGTGELIIGSGATFTLGANLTNSALKITLAGGTLDLNGYTGTFGNLNITGNSIINFGPTSNSTLAVQNLGFSSTALTLSIAGWTDLNDFFSVQNSPGPQGSTPTNQVVFTGFVGNDTKWLPYNTQLTPVPEPSTYGAMLLAGLMGFFGWRRYRQPAR